MGFKAYFDIAQRQAYDCEGLMRQAWQSQLHKPRVPELSWGWTGSQPSSCAFHTALWGGCGWKVECTPHVAALSRQLTKLLRCSCEPFWSFQFLASTNHPLSYPYTLCRCKGFWAVQHTESPSGLAGAVGSVMDYGAWSCQARENETPHTAAIPASAEMRKLKINSSSPPPWGTFRGLEQTSVEWSQYS